MLAWRTLLKRIRRILIVIALILVVLEAGLRGYVRYVDHSGKLLSQIFRADPVTGFSLRPNLRVPVKLEQLGLNFILDTNSRGLRGPEISVKQPGEYRVLVLGDSFAYGFGVEANQTFSHLLGERLGVRVVNAGTPGFGTAQELAFFEEYGSEMAPDMVVLGFFGNDYADNMKQPTFADGALWTDPVLIFGHASYVIGAFSKLVLRRNVMVGEDGFAGTIDVSRTHSLLSRLSDLCRSRKIPLRVMYIPHVDETKFTTQRRRGEGGTSVHRLSVAGLVEVDLLHAIERAAQSPYLPDGHLNPNGHRIVADVLAAEVTAHRGP
jgi:hypothetical protein